MSVNEINVVTRSQLTQLLVFCKAKSCVLSRLGMGHVWTLFKGEQVYFAMEALGFPIMGLWTNRMKV